MDLSQLIAALQAILKKEGDMPVYLDGDQEVKITTVELCGSNEDPYINIQ